MAQPSFLYLKEFFFWNKPSGLGKWKDLVGHKIEGEQCYLEEERWRVSLEEEEEREGEENDDDDDGDKSDDFDEENGSMDEVAAT